MIFSDFLVLVFVILRKQLGKTNINSQNVSVSPNLQFLLRKSFGQKLSPSTTLGLILENVKAECFQGGLLSAGIGLGLKELEFVICGGSNLSVEVAHITIVANLPLLPRGARRIKWEGDYAGRVSLYM